MDRKARELLDRLKADGLTAEREARLRAELEASPGPPGHDPESAPPAPPALYAHTDLGVLQALRPPAENPVLCVQSLDELLERDKQREKDGFPRKIRVGRLIKPGRGGKEKVVVVPTTVEEKLIHDNSFTTASREGQTGGAGEGEAGEVIGEQPVRPEGEEGQGGAGQGKGESHEMESSAYDLGKILTEKFELPNLKDKGKKRSLTRYTYDLTDRHRGFGQYLDKKATLKEVLQTNIHLGNVPDPAAIDPEKFLISPNDKVYRILSREKDFESQAVVFFLRDYSGSMTGKPTELVVTQHVLIYSWLLFQYERQIVSRFILHDTDAKEVPDFHTYYNSRVAGGTQVASAYRLVNEIVEKENLERDYNIYVFHGTDGDDWDSNGVLTVPELRKMLRFANRVGITVARHGGVKDTELESYLKRSKLLEDQPRLLRMDAMPEDSDEPRVIEGIRRLIS